ncbi:phage tail tape measure protein [Lachnospiraceae bacterium MD335]|nr:phage tail tape measure protein [Lachnospiraceae bacterium MD335]
MADNNTGQSILSEASESLREYISVSAGINVLVSKTKEALSELREVDTLLTQIANENDRLSRADLEEIGNNAFDTASKYGKSASDYLTEVQNASRAGYQNAAQIAELSLAAQSAGNITGELADRFITAADRAYELGGSVAKLTEILDGSFSISGRNAISMAELAEAMSAAGEQASKLGISADETAAVLSTIISGAHQSGAEASEAFESILLLIRQVADAGKGIDAESLTRYEKACRSLNVSLKETRNGVTSLRDPMEVLKDLSEAYSKLNTGDARKANLLDAAGGGINADALEAVLNNYSLYEQMLSQYAQGAGSMAQKAAQTADSWEGSMNRLSNTWTDTIGNIADSDAVITLVNGLNGLLSVINSITAGLGSFGTIGIGAGLFAGLKNIGKRRTSVRISNTVNCFEYALHA